MRRFLKLQTFPLVLLLLTMLCSFPVRASEEQDLHTPTPIKELSYGEILYEYYRGNLVDALNLILVAEKRGSLVYHKNAAQLLKGVIYLDLGMMVRAERIFRQLLTVKDLQSTTLAKLGFYLGKLHYRQGDYPAARARLMQSNSALPPELADEAKIMLGNMAAAEGDKEGARHWYASVSEESELQYFGLYNLAVLWLQDNDMQQAGKLFVQIYLASAQSEFFKSLQDKARLVTGYFWLNQGKYDKALKAFSEIRLNSPFATRALLGSAWGHLNAGKPQLAIPLLENLSRRDPRDAAVQEALLALPYAKQQLSDLQGALKGYERASDLLNSQLQTIQRIKQKVNSGELIETLNRQIERERFLGLTGASQAQFKLLAQEDDYYLYELLARHDFSEAFNQYQKLAELVELLKVWQAELPTFSEMVATNRNRFTEKQAVANARLEAGVGEAQQQTFEKIKNEIAALQQDQNLYLLADDRQLEAYRRIMRIKMKMASLPQKMITPTHEKKLRLLEGILLGELEQQRVAKEYALNSKLSAIKTALSEMKDLQRRIAQASSRAIARFAGFEKRIESGAVRIASALEKVDGAYRIKGDELKVQILAALEQRRALLEEYLLQSDLAIARLQEKALEEEGMW